MGFLRGLSEFSDHLACSCALSWKYYIHYLLVSGQCWVSAFLFFNDG